MYSIWYHITYIYLCKLKISSFIDWKLWKLCEFAIMNILLMLLFIFPYNSIWPFSEKVYVVRSGGDSALCKDFASWKYLILTKRAAHLGCLCLVNIPFLLPPTRVIAVNQNNILFNSNLINNRLTILLILLWRVSHIECNPPISVIKFK